MARGTLRTALASIGGTAALALVLLSGDVRVEPAEAAKPPAPLRFGIYPGGGVGTVLAPRTAGSAATFSEIGALKRLQGDARPLVMHLYTEIDGTSALDGHLQWAKSELDRYHREGFKAEFVLRHKPVSRKAGVAVDRYVRGVRTAVRRLGRHPALVGLQITNEVNIRNAPDAADGAYPGARKALVRGVIAARSELRRMKVRRVTVGFNVAESVADRSLWRDLRRLGGKRFARSVDWVGVDVYPSTWPASKPTRAGVRRHITRSLRTLRKKNLPAAGLGRRVKLHITENGYPTGPGRSESNQVLVMQESIRTVSRLRRRYGVSDYRWFNLRDADSSSEHFEHQYGVLRDDGTAKPAFAELGRLLDRLGAR
jgi:hypothetical protein